MDKRLYFVLGDLFGNLLAGALIGCLSWLIIGPGWPMMIAMLAMMLIGMFFSTLLWLPFSILFGAMEVMVPFMLTGMLSGMVVGMRESMQQHDITSCFYWGAACGLISIVVVWVLNNGLRGTEAMQWR